jgi:GAF domain-containing protein
LDGVVVTSNDNRSASGIRLDLNKYPEVLNAHNTGQLIAIENLELSPELKNIKAMLNDVNFNSMVVCPVFKDNQPFGVLSLRLPPEKETLSDNEIRFVEIVSHVVSLVISNQNHKGKKDFWLNENPAKPIPFPGPKIAKK